MTQLKNLPTVITSKNAGPFRVTLDIVFEDEADYRDAKDVELVSEELIMDLYQVPRDDIVGIHYYDPASAIKITVRRPIPSGHPSDPDVNGSQQHVPLLTIDL